MTFPLTFQGRIGRLAYLLSSAVAFLSQHLLVLLLFWSQHAPLQPDVWFYLVPLRVLVTQAQATAVVTLLAFAFSFMIAWVLAALAFRRAADADVNEWIAAGAILPMLQIPVILVLCVMPPRAASERPSDADDPDAVRWPTAVQGL